MSSAAAVPRGPRRVSAASHIDPDLSDGSLFDEDMSDSASSASTPSAESSPLKKGGTITPPRFVLKVVDNDGQVNAGGDKQAKQKKFCNLLHNLHDLSGTTGIKGSGVAGSGVSSRRPSHQGSGSRRPSGCHETPPDIPAIGNLFKKKTAAMKPPENVRGRYPSAAYVDTAEKTPSGTGTKDAACLGRASTTVRSSLELSRQRVLCLKVTMDRLDEKFQQSDVGLAGDNFCMQVSEVADDMYTDYEDTHWRIQEREGLRWLTADSEEYEEVTWARQFFFALRAEILAEARRRRDPQGQQKRIAKRATTHSSSSSSSDDGDEDKHKKKSGKHAQGQKQHNPRNLLSGKSDRGFAQQLIGDLLTSTRRTTKPEAKENVRAVRLGMEVSKDNAVAVFDRVMRGRRNDKGKDILRVRATQKLRDTRRSRVVARAAEEEKERAIKEDAAGLPAGRVHLSDAPQLPQSSPGRGGIPGKRGAQVVSVKQRSCVRQKTQTFGRSQTSGRSLCRAGTGAALDCATPKEGGPIVELPGLRYRHRKQWEILGGRVFNRKVKTLQRARREYAMQLGLDDDDWDIARSGYVSDDTLQGLSVLKLLQLVHVSATMIQAEWRRWIGLLQKERYDKDAEEAAEIIQDWWSKVARYSLPIKRMVKQRQQRNAAAARIQARVRGVQVRRRIVTAMQLRRIHVGLDDVLKGWGPVLASTIRIQAAFRGWLARRRLPKKRRGISGLDAPGADPSHSENRDRHPFKVAKPPTPRGTAMMSGMDMDHSRQRGIRRPNGPSGPPGGAQPGGPSRTRRHSVMQFASCPVGVSGPLGSEIHSKAALSIAAQDIALSSHEPRRAPLQLPQMSRPGTSFAVCGASRTRPLATFSSNVVEAGEDPPSLEEQTLVDLAVTWPPAGGNMSEPSRPPAPKVKRLPRLQFADDQ